MTEIYFINEYYVKTTSWQNAAKSWLTYIGDATDVKLKAIDSMDNFDDIMKLLDIFAGDNIDNAGIVKEYHCFNDYYEPNEEDF
jgi:hypothetical protein